jgi:Skp family chaperone for outer membrane proteins
MVGGVFKSHFVYLAVTICAVSLLSNQPVFAQSPEVAPSAENNAINNSPLREKALKKTKKKKRSAPATSAEGSENNAEANAAKIKAAEDALKAAEDTKKQQEAAEVEKRWQEQEPQKPYAETSRAGFKKDGYGGLGLSGVYGKVTLFGGVTFHGYMPQVSPEVEFFWGTTKNLFNDVWMDGYKSERLHLAGHGRFFPSNGYTLNVTGGAALDWTTDMWTYYDGSKRKVHEVNMELEAFVGNRWVQPSGLIVGCDWFGLGSHLFNIYARGSGGGIGQELVSTIRARWYTVYLLKTYVGFRF